MTDLQAEGDRLAGALRAALAIGGPVERYRALTEVQDGYDAMVSAIKVARGGALDELRPGTSWEVLAGLAGLGSYQKVQKLINAARAAQREEQQ